MSNDKKFICPLPFKSLSLAAGYKLRLCCHDDIAEEVESQDFSTDLNEGLHHRTRELMLKGEIPANCQTCFQIENRGGTSPRMGYLEKISLPDVVENKFYNFHHLDITIDNHCNLSCRMCSPEYSNNIRNEFEKMNIPTNSSFLNQWNQSQKDFDKTLALIKPAIISSEHIVITGGEPLLSPNGHKIVKELIKCDNIAKKTVRFFTNATVVPTWLPELLNSCLKVELYLSLDASNKELNYIRYPAKWESIKKNLEKLSLLSKEFPHLSLRVHTVIQALNLHVLVPLMKDLAPYSHLFPFVPSTTLLTSPSLLSATVLPRELKEKYLLQLNQYLSSILSRDYPYQEELESNIVLLKAHIQGLKDQDHSNKLIDFFIFMKKLDKSRRQSLKDHHPELYTRYK